MAEAIPIPPNARFQDISKQKFGKLTVRGYCGKYHSNALFLCDCECGGTSVATAANLTRMTSCGCNRGEKHGMAGKNATAEYRAWAAMIARCENRKSPK